MIMPSPAARNVAKRILDAKAAVGSTPLHVLGIEPAKATLALVHSTYRRLAVKLHPDKCGSDAMCSEAFRVVKEAAELLKDECAVADAKEVALLRRPVVRPSTDEELVDAYFSSVGGPRNRRRAFAEFVASGGQPAWRCRRAPSQQQQFHHTTPGRAPTFVPSFDPSAYGIRKARTPRTSYQWRAW